MALFPWPCYIISTRVSKKLVRLVCITQGTLTEITNQRYSLKYQALRQLAAAFISGEGSSKLPKRLVFQRKSLVGDFRKSTRVLITARRPEAEQG